MGKYRSSCVTSPTINIPHRMGNFFFFMPLSPKAHGLRWGSALVSDTVWVQTRVMTRVRYPAIRSVPLPPKSSVLRLSLLPLNPWQPLIFLAVAIVLPSPKCRVVGVTQYAAFSGWPLSLSNVHSGLLRVFSWLDSAFLFDAE